MTVSFLQAMQASHGTYSPKEAETEDELYVSPSELERLFGCAVTAQDIRAAMILINSYCHRASLWPWLCNSGILTLPPDRQETRLPLTPVLAVTEAAGRFDLGRRDNQGYNSYQTGVAAAYFMMLGGRPTWTQIDVNQIELDPDTGRVWIPNSFMIVRYNVVRLSFVAGYLTIPADVKLAVLEIVNTLHTKGVSDRIRYSVGAISRQYASDSFITPQAERLLAPYVVHSLY